MKFLLYFLLVPIIFSFLQSNTIFERKNIARKKHQEGRKQIIKHKKILYSNSELTLRGEYTRPVNLPLTKEGILVTECLFSNCYNHQSNGGAISVNIASGPLGNPKTKIMSSTFHECCTFLHDSKGGALFIQSFSFQSSNNCFSTCSSIFGAFCYYKINDTCDCDINQSIFHTSAKPGIGRGSVVVCSEYMKIIDNNFTKLIVGDEGSGLISTVSYEYYICRNVFQSCKGKSTIYIDIIPINSIFQLLNFIENVEKGSGIISIPNNYMFSKCFFHNCGPVLINSQKGKTFIYQCVFDSSLKSSNSIFIGSVKNKDPFWNGDDGEIRFGINLGNFNPQFCQKKGGGDIKQIFTPTRTPYFYGFSPNPADIVILVCIGILFVCLVFTLVYFLWYCICSKPNLKSSIEYLKTKEVDQYKDTSLLSSNDYSDSIFDMEESRDKKKKKKKSKKKKNLFDSDDEEIDNVVDEEDIKKSKKKKSKKKKNLFDSDDDGIDDVFDDEDIKKSKKKKSKKKKNLFDSDDEENVDAKSIKITDLSEGEDESKNKSDVVDKKKAKSKKKEKSKSKSKKEKSKSKSKSKDAKKPDAENKEKNTAPLEDELSISVPESDKIPATIINSSSDLGIPKEILSSEPHKKPETKLKTEPEPEPELNIEPEPEVEPKTKSKTKTEKNHKSKSKSKHKSHSKKKTEPDPLPEDEIDKSLNQDSASLNFE